MRNRPGGEAVTGGGWLCVLALISLSLVLCLSGAPAAASDGEGSAYQSGQITVLLEEGADIQEFNAQWGTTLLGTIPGSNQHLIQADEDADCEALSELMNADPRVSLADPNWLIESPEAVRQMVVGAIGGNWDQYQFQQMAEVIGLAEAHLYSQGEDVLIAVLDTGIEEHHEAFDDRLSDEGWDFVADDHDPEEEFNAIDDDGDSLVDEGFGHGTMVSGLIALVAPHAMILPIRILDDEGRTDLFTMAAGIEYALDHGADVINMSFGARLQSLPSLHYLFERCVAEGVIPVAGAGNDDLHDPPLYPALLDEVFMVTALDTLGVKADFADFHEYVLVSAPGVGLLSAYPENEDDQEWGLGAGCSFATALVSGEAALILGQNPLLTHAELRARIEAGVIDIYDIPGNEAYQGMLGSGMVYLPLAVDTDLTAAPPGGPVSESSLRGYPNPSSGIVRFALPAGAGDAACELSIFDVSGRLVRRLEAAGLEAKVWDGLDQSGRPCAVGSYFARLSTPREVYTAEIVLIR